MTHVSDYRELAELLFVGPAQIARPTDKPNAPRIMAEYTAIGDAIDNCPAGAAVIARPRPDVLAVDLDGCRKTAKHMRRIAHTYGGIDVYEAESGSPDSAHMILAFRGRRELSAARTDIRGLKATTGRIEFPARLRLPGSPSLKPGCGPVEAYHQADEVVEIFDRLGLPSTPPAVTEPEPVRHVDYRRPPRRELTEKESRLWAQARRGVDVGERSDIAARLTSVFAAAGWSDTEALAALLDVELVTRTWSQEQLLAEWRKACAWWAGRYAEHVAVVDQWEQVAAEWRTRAGHQQRHILAAACVHRFLDGGGLVDRPLAVRDVAGWTGLSKLAVSRALTLMAGNEDGALEVARLHKNLGRTEATTYTLRSPSAEIETRESTVVPNAVSTSAEIETRDYLHVLFPSAEIKTPEYTPPASLKNATRAVHTFENATHPVWQTFGASAAASTCSVWEVVAANDDVEKTAKAIAERVGLPIGHGGVKPDGVRGILAALSGAGLVNNNGGVWSCTDATLDEVAANRRVDEMLLHRAATIAAERAQWREKATVDDTPTLSVVPALPVTLESFTDDVVEHCGELSDREHRHVSEQYEFAGERNAHAVVETILTARKGAELARRAGEDPESVSLIVLKEDYIECAHDPDTWDERAGDLLPYWRALRASA